MRGQRRLTSFLGVPLVLTLALAITSQVLAHDLPIERKFSWYLVLKKAATINQGEICFNDVVNYRGDVPPEIEKKLGHCFRATPKNRIIITRSDVYNALAALGVTPPRLLGSKVLIKPTPQAHVKAETLKKKIIKKGDALEIVYNLKGLRITTQARALQPGAAGEIIKAGNGRKTFLVKITSINEAAFLKTL